MKEADNIIKEMIKKEAWQITIGYGSMLSIDFGDKIINKKDGNVHGEWNLWTYSSVWRIDKEGYIEIGSEDNMHRIKKYLYTIEKLILLDISIDFKNFYSELLFENEIVLKIFPVISENEKHWMLFTPYKKVLVAGPKSTFSWQIYE